MNNYMFELTIVYFELKAHFLRLPACALIIIKYSDNVDNIVTCAIVCVSAVEFHVQCTSISLEVKNGFFNAIQ